VSVLASAGALPAVIASKKTPDAKFLSLNRWRKPSEVLSRNWRRNTLNTKELYEKRLYHLRVEVPNASSLHKSQGRRHL
jgi:hypothetical protein